MATHENNHDDVPDVDDINTNYDKLSWSSLVDACIALDGVACVKAGLRKRDENDMLAAVEFFKKGCQLSESMGCFNAGVSLVSDAANERDAIDGLSLLKRACELGDIDGCYNSGILLTTRFSKEPYARSDATVYLSTACEQGKGTACRALAYNVYDEQKPNEVELFVRALRDGCELDDAESCVALGHLCLKGKAGLKKEPLRAASLYGKACQLSDGDGCSYLAVCYYRGHGVAKDLGKMAKYSQYACSFGSAEGCRIYATCLRDGVGVTKNEVEAALYERRFKELA